MRKQILVFIGLALILLGSVAAILYHRNQTRLEQERMEMELARQKYIKATFAYDFGFTNLIGANRDDVDGALSQFILSATRITLWVRLGAVEDGREQRPQPFRTDQFGREIHNYLLTYFEGREWFTPEPLRNPGIDIHYTEVLFVHTEAEARALTDVPNHVLVVFPRLEPSEGDTRQTTEQMLRSLNATVQDRGVDLAEFGLVYPITLENVVEDWEKVFDVCLALGIVDDQIYVIRTEKMVQECYQ